MARNLVLIGYRGTGKTAVAAYLGERLNREVISLDQTIEERAGMGIPAIVEEEGWPGFRDRETALVKEVGRREDLVIDTGGGAVLRSENVEALKRHGVLFWLRADVAAIQERIAGSGDRPSLTGDASFLDEIPRVLAEREPLYEDAADYTVETTGRAIEEVVEEIYDHFLSAMEDLAG